MTEKMDLSFAIAEYEARLELVREEMRSRGADVLIVDESEHLYHLTGSSPSATVYQACIIPLQGMPTMVLRQLDVLAFVERSWVRDCVGFKDSDDPFPVIAATMAERGLADKRVAVEFDSHYLTIQ